MHSITLRAFVFWISPLVAGVPVIAQDRGAPRPGHDGPATVRNYREAAISPDGQRVAWVEVLDGAGGPAGSSGIFVADLAAGEGMPRRVTANDDKTGCAEHSIAWSPDGKQLAFLSDRDRSGQLQIYVAPADGGPARRLTTVSGFLTDPRWSPDGARLGILFTQGAPGRMVHCSPARPRRG